MRRPLALTAVALSGILLAGCASTPETPTADVNTDATINIQVGLEPTSLDVRSTAGASLQQLLIGNVYEGLVARIPGGEVEPALATVWTVSDDGLTYSFDLRDAVFHDGAPLTVDDVVSSLEAASAEGSLNPDAKKMTGVASVAAVDDDTVEIALDARDINFLDTLASTGGLIVRANESADLANVTNGTGPYGVDQWNKGATIALERFDDYWGDAPLNRTVVFHYIAEPTTALNALATGEVDILTGATAETVEYFEGEGEMVIIAGEATSWMTLGMNSGSGPLADVDVRRAINMAVDKEGLVEALGGYASIPSSLTATTDPWYTDLSDVNPYDPEAARALLAEAGYTDLGLTLTVANNYDTKISEYVAAQLAEVGISLDIVSVEFSTWLEQVYNGKEYELTLVLHVDPWTLTYYGNPDYYWNYDDTTAQQLVVAARKAADFAERDALLSELAVRVAEQAASGWLYSPQSMVIATPAVTGYPVDRIANHLPVSEITVAG